jgi:tRNA(Ile2)-agmatinylcytidine synthase
MAWEPADSTYEVITYRPAERWGTRREYDASSIAEADILFPGTFNSWDNRENKAVMVPSSPCPVMFGLRGDDERETITASMHIRTEKTERWMTFLTNQGTDDHVIRNAEQITENGSYEIEGTVTSYPGRVPGGHALMDIETVHGIVACAAYEPSKEFRMLFDNLMPGDRIAAIGELRERPRTLNAEKIRVISVSDHRREMNPLCGGCGKRMESSGRGQGYRCRTCRTHSAEKMTEKIIRWVVPGWYEPPASSRRHLSKPLKRMGTEQQVEFVNSRRQ